MAESKLTSWTEREKQAFMSLLDPKLTYQELQTAFKSMTKVTSKQTYGRVVVRKLKDTYYRGILGIKILMENSGGSLTSASLQSLPADFNPFDVTSNQTSAKVKQVVSAFSAKPDAFQVSLMQNAMRTLSNVMRNQSKKKPPVETPAKNSFDSPSGEDAAIKPPNGTPIKLEASSVRAYSDLSAKDSCSFCGKRSRSREVDVMLL
jgi:hypothetical protein